MINLGIILARANSKRLPGKNIKLLAGNPLISYTIKAALGSSKIDDLIVSTDCNIIAEISRSHGAKAPFLRPARLAEDNTTSEETLIHAVETYEKMYNAKVANVILLQPTSPFTTPEMIDSCISKLDDSTVSCITVVEATKKCEWYGTIIDTRFSKLISQEQNNQFNGIKQYLPSGNVYAVKRDFLMKEKKIMSNHTTAHIVNLIESVDIDYEIDFKFAEFLLTKNI